MTTPGEIITCFISPAEPDAIRTYGLTGIRAVNRRAQCLTNGIALNAVSNTRSVHGAVLGSSWAHNVAIHHSDIPSHAWLMAIAAPWQLSLALGDQRQSFMKFAHQFD